MKVLKQMVMKKILTILAFFFFSYGFSQTGINYQAIIKNSSGNVYSNATMIVTFSLRYDTSGGSVIYSETHNATSTSEGQISLVVGTGNKTSNGVDFSAIDFSRSIFYTTEVNIGGAGNVSLGTQQLRSVSSAYFARSVPDIFIGDFPASSTVSMTGGVAIGNNVLLNNTDGYAPTAVGNSALRANSTGNHNTAIGNFASSSNTSGDFNVGVGNIALSLNTTGDSNTAVGYAALATNTIGNNNTAIGFGALDQQGNTNNNTAIGVGAGFPAYIGGAYVTGNNNTYIGTYTQNKLTTSNSTAIGYGASISASNTIQLGNTAITDVLTSGVVSATGFQTTGTVTATSFVGDGSLLSNLPSSSANNRIWISHREFGDNTQDISRYMGSFNGYSYEFLNLEKGSSGISQTRAYFLPPSHWGNGSYKITMYFLTPNANSGNIQVSGGVRTTTLSGTASTTGNQTQVISTGSDFSGNSHGGFQYGGASGFPGPLSAAATVGTNSSFSRPLQKVTYTTNYNFSNIDFAVFYLSRYLNTGYSYSDTYNGDFYVVGIKIEKNY